MAWNHVATEKTVRVTNTVTENMTQWKHRSIRNMNTRSI